MLTVRRLARALIPFPVRLEVLRLKRRPRWLVETPVIARTRLPENERERFAFSLACHSSPLERAPDTYPVRLQRGKERNVATAAGMLDGLVIPPYQVFSYHRLVGRPSRLRGFRDGLELHEGVVSHGVGGGCCQISNALYLIALRGGMKIVERHRHGLDLFPDHGRTIPFGCGATVFYNYADFRFENPLPLPVLLHLAIRDKHLISELRTIEDPGWTAEIYETDHRFFRGDEGWMRENRIHRRFLRSDGSLLCEQEVAHNLGRVLYEPPVEEDEGKC